jgi:hypothetical protein
MSEPVHWTEVGSVLDSLYRATDRLEQLFPGRKFTPDGHLVGSIGEVVAAYMFDLDLHRGSNKGHDGVTRGGYGLVRQVEVKLTQGTTVAIRHQPAHLIVLQRKKGRRVEVVFNGPGLQAWEGARSKGSNGQRPISVSKLRELNNGVADTDRLSVIREAPV